MGLQQSFIVYRINTRGSQNIRTHHFLSQQILGFNNNKKEKNLTKWVLVSEQMERNFNNQDLLR